jgi:hypothetical protein
MAFVFRVTGESPPNEHILTENITRPFRETGFATRIEWVVVPGSRLLFIIAEPTVDPVQQIYQD